LVADFKKQQIPRFARNDGSLSVWLVIDAVPRTPDVRRQGLGPSCAGLLSLAGGDVHLVEAEGVIIAGYGRVAVERVGYEIGPLGI
jgi:hypothetical protein